MRAWTVRRSTRPESAQSQRATCRSLGSPTSFQPVPPQMGQRVWVAFTRVLGAFLDCSASRARLQPARAVESCGRYVPINGNVIPSSARERCDRARREGSWFLASRTERPGSLVALACGSRFLGMTIPPVRTATDAVQIRNPAGKIPEKPHCVRISTASLLDKPREHGLNTR